jgi:hypothetical protein
MYLNLNIGVPKPWQSCLLHWFPSLLKCVSLEAFPCCTGNKDFTKEVFFSLPKVAIFFSNPFLLGLGTSKAPPIHRSDVSGARPDQRALQGMFMFKEFSLHSLLVIHLNLNVGTTNIKVDMDDVSGARPDQRALRALQRDVSPELQPDREVGGHQGGPNSTPTFPKQKRTQTNVRYYCVRYYGILPI